MKRFVFSLETVYQYKQTLEKEQKAELRRARGILAELYEEDARLDKAYADNRESLDKALARRQNLALELSRHEAYFRYLRELKTALAPRIADAEDYVQQCLEILIQTMREVKTYAKLKDEKYAEYLVEVDREEQKEMGDIVSFKTVAGDVG